MVDEEQLPSVTVIVPVLDGERTIGDCLSSLVGADYPPDRREIVVIDNGSRDRTREIIERYPVRSLHEPRRGTSWARNRGIEESESDIVALTDSDCVASTGWLRELTRPFGQGSVGGVAGEILPFPPHTAAERHAAKIRHLSPQRYLRRPILPFAVTANLAFRRNVFAHVGLFDTSAPRGGESTDFCTRFFRGTGLRLEFAPAATVFHRHRTTTAELFRQQWSYGRGHAFLYMKYHDEIPWGWSQTVRVYRDLIATAGSLTGTVARYALGRTRRDELEFQFFQLVRKVGLRLGFAREALAHGHLYL